MPATAFGSTLFRLRLYGKFQVTLQAIIREDLVEDDLPRRPDLLAARDDELRREEEAVAVVAQLRRVRVSGALAGVPVVRGSSGRVWNVNLEPNIGHH